MSECPEIASVAVESVSADGIRTMALLLRDPNPMHVDPTAAKELGFSGVVSQGAMNLGYVLNALLAIDNEPRIERVTARFTSNVMAGDRVIAAVTPIEISEGAADTIEVAVSLDVAHGSRAIEATATLRVASA